MFCNLKIINETLKRLDECKIENWFCIINVTNNWFYIEFK